MSSYWGQGVLLFLIQGYRRHLSGRGPLKRVSCTFHRCESCSAYGLRVVSECDSLFMAIRLLRGRLRRCGEASLFRTNEALLWGELYQTQDPEVLEASLVEAREAPGAIRAMLLQAARVARFQGDFLRAKRLLQKTTQYPDQGELLVRRGDGILGVLKARLLQFLSWPLGLWLVSLLGFFFAGLPSWGLVFGGVGGLLWAVMIGARYGRRRAFFLAQLASLAFLPPHPRVQVRKA